MALYEFFCQECLTKYESIARHDPANAYEGVSCPYCGSPEKVKLMSTFSFAFGNPVGTDRYENSHDYRAKHKAPAASAERDHAASKSHVGPDPYTPIDDISQGNFGEVT